MTTRGILRPLSVAPMLDRTDRHYRFLMRQITKHTLLYTEMIPVGALVHGNKDRALAYSEVEHPIALQLGGDDIKDLTTAARIGEDYGYDEINLNVGCPSDRVQQGNFGACLMAHPQRVAQSVDAMRCAVNIPVTVKHRIGIDDHDDYEFLAQFVRTVTEAHCDRFTVHARIALLNGLSPKDNRKIPALRYNDVYRLKREFPKLPIEINGGIVTLDGAVSHLDHVDSVMIGRAAYDTPFEFAGADARFFGAQATAVHRQEVVEAMLPYIAAHMKGPRHRMLHVTRHMLQLYAGQPGARLWRRKITQWSQAESSDNLHRLGQLAKEMTALADARL